ncbi:hypothetical protein ACSQ67_002078 [Phaseolus vulgaris]
MASLEIKSGTLVSLQDLHPSSPFFKQGASLRITGNISAFMGHSNKFLYYISFGVVVAMPVISDGSEASVNNLCIAFHRLREYSVEAGVATIIDGDDILKVSTEHLRDLSFQVGSVYQFIGELLIQPDNEVILQARVGRNVDGIDLNLYHQSLMLLRQFQANHLNNPETA